MGDFVNDGQELNEILKNSSSNTRVAKLTEAHPISTEGVDLRKVEYSYTRWSTSDDILYFPCSKTVQKLIPGCYVINISQTAGLYFEKVPIKTEELMRFPDSTSDKVIKEIDKFWNEENKFKKYGLLHKRGIMLWGPPGSGKSCTIRILMEDVISRGGIVINFTNPAYYIAGMRVLRTIQPDIPVVTTMEDIDSIIERYQESEILNILDGVEEINKNLFLATTNYPERLGARIINRPSRFDRRFKIGLPSEEARRMYIKSLFTRNKEKINNLEKWVEDTEEFSIAHIRELFVAVVILEDNYDEAVNILKDMKDIPCSSRYDSDNSNFGFAKKSAR